jgi:hypothetical protein
MMRIFSSLVLVFVVVVSARTASAEKATSTSAKEKAAKKACALGDYQKGTDILADLFVDTNDTTYIYNQGRCYQQNGIFEKAVLRFREYLRKVKNLSNSDRTETERQISDCEASLGKAALVAPPPVSTSSSVAPIETQLTVPAPQTAAPAVSVKPTPTPTESSQGKDLRTAGIICAAGGLAAVGAGVGLALKTQNISSDEQKHGATPAKESQRKSLETWGWIGYGVGAAALGTGAVLYIAGRRDDQRGSLALLPILAPNSASVMMKGSF